MMGLLIILIIITVAIGVALIAADQYEEKNMDVGTESNETLED